ncbi:MAG: sigma-70 family polymerase sigma factor [Thermoleophilia bacterium]|nr:sigma-70 family polymerase sigma factor [Thermoleophilia bacterium]
MITAMHPAAPPFQRFLLEHRDAVLRLLVGMVGPIDAEDCFQESFLKALRAWPPADLDGRLDTWMLTIAHRTALDHLRRRGAIDIALDHAGELDSQAEPDEVGAGLLGVWAQTPDGLWAAVGGLPNRQRAAVVLRVVLDQSHAQVAGLLDCSEAAARRSYADGLAALRARIADGTLEVTR